MADNFSYKIPSNATQLEKDRIRKLRQTQSKTSTDSSGATSIASGLAAHIANTENPHTVIAGQVTIVDAGDIIIATKVEEALQEMKTLIDINTFLSAGFNLDGGVARSLYVGVLNSPIDGGDANSNFGGVALSPMNGGTASSF